MEDQGQGKMYVQSVYVKGLVFDVIFTAKKYLSCTRYHAGCVTRFLGTANERFRVQKSSPVSHVCW